MPIHVDCFYNFLALNRGEIKDTEMDSIMDVIVSSLFSVFATLGTVPIIRCPRGNAAEMVAEKLNKKLRENIWDPKNTLFQADGARGGFRYQTISRNYNKNNFYKRFSFT